PGSRSITKLTTLPSSGHYNHRHESHEDRSNEPVCFSSSDCCRMLAIVHSSTEDRSSPQQAQVHGYWSNPADAYLLKTRLSRNFVRGLVKVLKFVDHGRDEGCFSNYNRRMAAR